MAFYDLPLHELQTYQPAREEPGDFDRFWQESLAEARRHPLDAVSRLRTSACARSRPST